MTMLIDWPQRAIDERRGRNVLSEDDEDVAEVGRCPVNFGGIAPWALGSGIRLVAPARAAAKESNADQRDT